MIFKYDAAAWSYYFRVRGASRYHGTTVSEWVDSPVCLSGRGIRRCHCRNLFLPAVPDCRQYAWPLDFRTGCLVLGNIQTEAAKLPASGSIQWRMVLYQCRYPCWLPDGRGLPVLTAVCYFPEPWPRRVFWKTLCRYGIYGKQMAPG